MGKKLLVSCCHLQVLIVKFVCVCVFQDEEELVLPLRPQKSPLNGLCCLTFGLVVFMAGLVLASIYVYRYYFIPHVRLQTPCWVFSLHWCLNAV